MTAWQRPRAAYGLKEQSALPGSYAKWLCENAASLGTSKREAREIVSSRNSDFRPGREAVTAMHCSPQKRRQGSRLLRNDLPLRTTLSSSKMASSRQFPAGCTTIMLRVGFGFIQDKLREEFTQRPSF